MSVLANSAIANSYRLYKEISDSMYGPKGCSPKEYGEYLQGKKHKQKGNTKSLKRGMRK